MNCNDSAFGEHTLHRAIMLHCCCLFHMPATHPHPIMLYQLSGMLGLTRKNVLVFLTTSKTGPNPLPSPRLFTTLSFPNTNLVSILKKAAFNGQLSLQQVCLNVCGTFNDIFNSLFLPFCATFRCQALTVKCIIMKLLFPLKPVSNLMHL